MQTIGQMTTNKLIAPNDPRLKVESFSVDVDNIKYLGDVLDSMFSIMRDHGGLGLSASQIGRNQRFFVMNKISDGGVFWSNDKVFINPLIVEQSNHYEWGREGCLSLPGVVVNIKRPLWVEVWYLNREGKEVEEKLYDLAARVFFHEFDHLRGILITDH